VRYIELHVRHLDLDVFSDSYLLIKHDDNIVLFQELVCQCHLGVASRYHTSLVRTELNFELITRMLTERPEAQTHELQFVLRLYERLEARGVAQVREEQVLVRGSESGLEELLKVV